MNSSQYREAYVWIWPPGQVDPVVAGKLTKRNNQLIFNYGKSYLARESAVAIYPGELPLKRGELPLLPGLVMPNCIRDASPDAWGRRVIMCKQMSMKNPIFLPDLDELTYLLESGSDRVGALDFQCSPTIYEPRESKNISLEELLTSAERVEQGLPLTAELDRALYHGTSIGGARPKALIESEGIKYIAKFVSNSDLYSVVKAEFIAMRLAEKIGLHVAPVRLTRALKKEVLLIERFDRVHCKEGWQRRLMLSALTLFGFDEMMARYASYEKLAEIIRYQFAEPSMALRELFSRMVFNVLVGNTDDHARNHAAIWDGSILRLSPAYDICPQNRTGNEATQAMLIHGNNRHSQLAMCLAAAPHFFLSTEEARQLIYHHIDVINTHWESVCDEAHLSVVDRRHLWHRQFLNPYAFVGFEKFR